MADQQPQIKHYWLSENIQAVGFILLILIGFAYFQWGNGSDSLKTSVRDLMFLAATFYYGGSRSSVKKDETIATLSQQPTVTTADTVNVNPQPATEQQTDDSQK